MTELTKKQQAYVKHKIAGCTNKDAAIAAGYAVGSAAQAGDRLAKHPAVRKALNAASPAKGKGVDTRAIKRGDYADSKAFLHDAMNNVELPIGLRMDAAKALLPYEHARMGETGKKEKAKEKAGEIARGKSKFATKQPPQTNVVPFRTE